MKILNIDEQHNPNNGYSTTTYKLDERISKMDVLVGILRSFEKEDIKMTDCMCTSYSDDYKTEIKHYDSYADMLSEADMFNNYTQFSANYIYSTGESYAFDIVVFGNSDVVEKVINPNKITKDEGRGRKI